MVESSYCFFGGTTCEVDFPSCSGILTSLWPSHEFCCSGLILGEALLAGAVSSNTPPVTTPKPKASMEMERWPTSSRQRVKELEHDLKTKHDLYPGLSSYIQWYPVVSYENEDVLLFDTSKGCSQKLFPRLSRLCNDMTTCKSLGLSFFLCHRMSVVAPKPHFGTKKWRLWIETMRNWYNKRFG